MPAAVHAASSSDGDVDLVRVVENEEVQAIGNTTLEGVPAIMMALETLTEIHPFLMGITLPLTPLIQLKGETSQSPFSHLN
jgi:hypothetical protein